MLFPQNVFSGRSLIFNRMLPIPLTKRSGESMGIKENSYFQIKAKQLFFIVFMHVCTQTRKAKLQLCLDLSTHLWSQNQSLFASRASSSQLTKASAVFLYSSYVFSLSSSVFSKSSVCASIYLNVIICVCEVVPPSQSCVRVHNTRRFVPKRIGP